MTLKPFVDFIWINVSELTINVCTCASLATCSWLKIVPRWMTNMNYEIRAVDWIKAEALGKPGARHFRIIVYGQGNRASLWIEKGQLLRLCIGIRQLIATQPVSYTHLTLPTKA